MLHKICKIEFAENLNMEKNKQNKMAISVIIGNRIWIENRKSVSKKVNLLWFLKYFRVRYSWDSLYKVPNHVKTILETINTHTNLQYAASATVAFNS